MDFIMDKRFIVGLILGFLLCHFMAKGKLSMGKKGDQ